MIFKLMFSSHGVAPDMHLCVMHHDELQGEFVCDNNPHNIEFGSEDTEERIDQSISIVLQGKTPDHTQLDNRGNIISDAHIKVEKIYFNGVDVTETFCDGRQCYHHNQNGSSDWQTNEFHGYIGCNGTVTLDFYTPLYRWFLE